MTPTDLKSRCEELATLVTLTGALWGISPAKTEGKEVKDAVADYIETFATELVNETIEKCALKADELNGKHYQTIEGKDVTGERLGFEIRSLKLPERK